MIVDDVEGFLKFLDDVSLQLAYLLDLDSQQDGSNRGSKRAQKASVAPKSSTKVPRSRSSNNRVSTNKRQARLQQQQRPVRAKDRRKSNFQEPVNSNEFICSPNHIDQQRQQHQRQNHQQDQFVAPIGDINLQQLNHSQAQQSHHMNQDIASLKLQHSTHPNSESTHTIDGQLTLDIADELQPLDHGTSISPPTHLSPMDPTIQFNTLHQQHYYTPQRGHLDSYQLHDEFNSHDTIPIADSSAAHLSQDQQQHQQRVDHQHLIGHQQQSTTIRNDHSIDNSGCYGHHHHHVHHIHQHHQHNSHQGQYQQLDHQWIAATHDNDSNLQLGSAGAESSSLDHVVSMSPTTHQTIDQGQFTTPLYHHSYYNHQTEQLDSFQHVGDDYANNTGSLTASGSSGPLTQLHRIDQQQHQQEQPTHHQHQSQPQLRLTNLSLNNVTPTNSYNQHNNHHNQHHAVNQIHSINEPYNNNHSQQHHHHHQHHQHQMMPLMNGLEPNGVIIQDINLAAASWSSPEDLYSI